MNSKRLFLAGTALFLFLVALPADQKSIVIDSSPRGASVYWQGEKLGATPLTITPRTPGAADFFKEGNRSFDLYLHKEFHQTETATVTQQDTFPARIHISLTLLPRLPLYDGIYARKRRLRISDVVHPDLEQLARMREEVYAQHGRPVKDKRFARYFRKTRWYKINPYYDDSLLSSDDKANIKLINDFLEENDTDVALFKRITKQYEYRSADGKHYIRFINARRCVVGFPEDGDHNYSIVPYFFRPEQEFGFVVAGGKIYLRQYGHTEVQLDVDNRRLIGIKTKDEY
jgi:hypothetical protein